MPTAAEQLSATATRRPAITGMGVFCAGVHGVDALRETLRRAPAFDPVETRLLFEQAENQCLADHVERLAGAHPAGEQVLRVGRRESATNMMTLLAALEAWVSANPGVSTPEEAERVGCVVAANNHFDYELEALLATNGTQPTLVSPRERLACLDPYLVGVLSKVFGFRGHASTVGAQSASSSSAIVQAVALLRAGLLDHCLVVAPMFYPSDSFQEMLVNLGVVSQLEEPAVRPFDAEHAGTLPAPIAAAVVLSVGANHQCDAILVEGVGSSVHPTTDTEPDVDAEVRAMRSALRDAAVSPVDIDYVSAHATGTARGDECEAIAIGEVFANHAAMPHINATKAIVGHGFNSAGIVGVIAACLQLTAGFVHDTPGLVDPIVELAWFKHGESRAPHQMRRALCNAFSFFGINTSVVLARSASAWTGEGDRP